MTSFLSISIGTKLKTIHKYLKTRDQDLPGQDVFFFFFWKDNSLYVHIRFVMLCESYLNDQQFEIHKQDHSLQIFQLGNTYLRESLYTFPHLKTES